MVAKKVCQHKEHMDVFKEIRRQFHLEDVAYQPQRRIQHLKHIGLIREYVKELFIFMLEISYMNEEDLLFNVMDNLQ